MTRISSMTFTCLFSFLSLANMAVGAAEPEALHAASHIVRRAKPANESDAIHITNTGNASSLTAAMSIDAAGQPVARSHHPHGNGTTSHGPEHLSEEHKSMVRRAKSKLADVSIDAVGTAGHTLTENKAVGATEPDASHAASHIVRRATPANASDAIRTTNTDNAISLTAAMSIDAAGQKVARNHNPHGNGNTSHVPEEPSEEHKSMVRHAKSKIEHVSIDAIGTTGLTSTENMARLSHAASGTVDHAHPKKPAIGEGRASWDLDVDAAELEELEATSHGETLFRKDSVPVDCKSVPGSWSKCSEKCGGGERSRSDRITKMAKNGGDDCIPFDETEECNIQDCPTTAPPPTLPPMKTGAPRVSILMSQVAMLVGIIAALGMTTA